MKWLYGVPTVQEVRNKNAYDWDLNFDTQCFLSRVWDNPCATVIDTVLPKKIQWPLLSFHDFKYRWNTAISGQDERTLLKVMLTFSWETRSYFKCNRLLQLRNKKTLTCQKRIQLQSKSKLSPTYTDTESFLFLFFLRSQESQIPSDLPLLILASERFGLVL